MSVEDVVAHEARVAAEGIADIVKLVASRNWLGVGKRAFALALDLVPAETLRGYLDEAAVSRAAIVTNAALDAKFGPEK